MLIVALVLAVIGLAALVTAVVTSNEVVAWVCIAASAVGVLLLIVDAVRERKTRRFEAALAGEAEESDPPFIADAENTEIIEATESTQVIEAAAVTDVLSDADDEVIADVEMTADVEMITAEDHPEELVHDEPEYDMPSDDEPEYSESAEQTAVHIVDEETVAAESDGADNSADDGPDDNSAERGDR
jgi:hypothetical protein